MKTYNPAKYINCHDCGKVLIKAGNKSGQPRRCMACFQRFRIANPTFTKLYKGGKTMMHGYVIVRANGHPDAIKGYIREHRLIAEKMIGRRLKASEIVHHINGIKSDNRPENLVVCETNGEHIKQFHRRKSCTICGKPSVGRSYCSSHYQKFRKWGTPFEPNHKKNPVIEKCKLCGGKHTAKGYCQYHYDSIYRQRFHPRKKFESVGRTAVGVL